MTDPHLQIDPLEARRQAYRRAVRVGLAISFVAHLLVIFILGQALSLDPASFRSPPRRTIRLQGLPVVQVDELSAEFASDPDAIRLPLEEEQEPEEEQPEGETRDGPPAIQLPGRGLVGPPSLTNAEKLQPQEGDERLWYDAEGQPIPDYLARNPYAAYEGEIRARLSMILDSLSLSEEQRRRATEWLTGEEGHEWGVSEDGIHIAGVLIPINLGQLFELQGPSGRESRQEMRDLGDIRMQDVIGEADAIRKQRAKEMRERTKEELERRLRDSLEVLQDST